MSPPSSPVVELHVAPSPHLRAADFNTRRIMGDVMIGLFPVTVAAIYLFQWYALQQFIVCMGASLAMEAFCEWLRGREHRLYDGTALITGWILALSLPAAAPWYVGLIGAAVAIGIGKMVFGGMGMNLFNPAMVGRAFVMIAFAGAMAAAGYELPLSQVDVLSGATPLNAFKQGGVVTPLVDLFWGNTNGSLGETSILACLVGGIYVCWRRAAAWEIPAGILVCSIVLAAIAQLAGNTAWGVVHHLFSGALVFGAFFIATDPVTSPLSGRGRFIFGAGIGAIVMLLRIFSGYPEGVMFAVLLMNALTPLINRWTIPKPFGDQ